MAQVTFEVSPGFLTRARAVLLLEQPALQGQANAVINEAVRVRIRRMIRDWVNAAERAHAVTAAQNNVAYPTDSDIA